MTSSELQVRSYLAQKLGTNRNECEDALAYNLQNGAFALADGATEAFDSRFWAQLLTRAWVRYGRPVSRDPFVEMAQCLSERTRRRWVKKKLAWYAEEKARSGSYAAFIGMVFEFEYSGLQWRSI